MTLSAFFINVFLFLNLVCIIAVLFFEHKNPGSSIAWILVLIFLPVVGIVAYLFVGTGFHVNKRKKFAFKAAADNLFNKYLAQELPLRETLSFMEEHSRLARMVGYLGNASEGVYTNDNSVDVYTNGTETFEAMLQDLRNAKHHIHLLYYIIRDDDLGREMLALLTQKAREGVEVRLMYDSVGSFPSSSKLFAGLIKAGGEVQAFYPMWLFKLSQFRLNYRNHRKLTIVDGIIGYIGGMNVGVEYLGRNAKLTPWRDTHLRVTGMAVWFLQERFVMDWCYALEVDLQSMEVPPYFPKSLGGGQLGMQIVSCGPDTEASPIKGGMMEMIYTARRNVYIQSPYFTPDEAFLDAMCNAARAGVDVRLMLPGLSDHYVVHCATMSYARQALAAGVRVYLYTGFLHAKTVVFDGLVACIGTCNIGYRSFNLNFEVTTFIYNEGFAQEQENIFLADTEQCVELTKKWYAEQSLITRGAYSASRLFAPLM